MWLYVVSLTQVKKKMLNLYVEVAASICLQTVRGQLLPRGQCPFSAARGRKHRCRSRCPVSTYGNNVM